MREVFEPSDTYQMEAAANNDAELSLLFNAASLTLGSSPPTWKGEASAERLHRSQGALDERRSWCFFLLYDQALCFAALYWRFLRQIESNASTTRADIKQDFRSKDTICRRVDCLWKDSVRDARLIEIEVRDNMHFLAGQSSLEESKKSYPDLVLPYSGRQARQVVLVPDARRITHTTAVKIRMSLTAFETLQWLTYRFTVTILAFIYAPLNTATSIYGIEHAADQQQWTQHWGLHHYSRYRPSLDRNIMAHDGRTRSNQSLAWRECQNRSLQIRHSRSQEPIQDRSPHVCDLVAYHSWPSNMGVEVKGSLTDTDQ